MKNKSLFALLFSTIIPFILTANTFNPVHLYETESCPNPSAQSAAPKIIAATLNWQENGSATVWEIEWGISGFSQGTGTVITGISSKPFELTGLILSTTYDWYLRSNCGGETSTWVGPHSFTTSDGKAQNPNPATGTINVNVTSTTISWDAVAGADGYKITAGTGWGATNIADDVSCASNSFTYASNWPSESFILWQINTVYNGGSEIIGDLWGFITDTTCSSPQNLAHSNVNYTGATLSWEDASGSHWDIYICPKNDPDPLVTAVPTINDHSSLSYIWTNANPETEYKWFVRGDCGQDNLSVSTWQGPKYFTTPHTPVPVQSIPFSEDWEVNSINTVWEAYEGDYAHIYNDAQSANNGTYGLRQYATHYTSYSVPINLTDAYIYAQPGGLNEEFTSWVEMSIDLSATTYPYLVFWYKMGWRMGGDYNNFWVQASTDQVVWTDLFATQTSGASIFMKKEIDIRAYNGISRLYIRFFHNGTYSENYLYLDDITITDLSCPKPTDLQETPTANSATLNWTENGAATSWDIEWGLEGFTQGDGTMISGTSTKPYVLGSLDPMESYDWYIRASCGGGDFSEWVEPNTFTTDCGDIDRPFTENFDNVYAPDIADCWQKIINSSSPQVRVETTHMFTAQSYPNQIRLYNSYDAAAELLLITPHLTNLTNQQNQIRFYAREDQGDVDLIIGTMSDPTDASTFTAYKTIDLSDTYEEYIIMFKSSYTETDEYIAFKIDIGQTYRTILIDDFVYEVAPSCPRPTDQDEDNLASDGAELIWTETDAATEWNIRIGEHDYDTTGTSYYTVNSNPITVDTLDENTSYDWYVRSSCGGGDFSEWIGPSEFQTNCNATTADVSEDFDAVGENAIPDCWSDIVSSTSDNASVETYSYANPHSTPYHLRLTNGNDASAELLLISQQYSDLPGQGNQIRFYAKANDTQDLLIGSISDPTDENTFTAFKTISLTTAYIEYAVEFDASYTETDEYIAFKHGQGTPNTAIYIDDYVYESIPSCKTPITQSVSNENINGAQLSWTEVGSSANWDLYIIQSGGDAPETETSPTINDITGNPYNWTGGTAGTTYEWWVRSDCGGDNMDVSTWKGYHTFNTPITNDDCSGAVSLPVGYSEDWIQGTNKGATDSNNNPDPIPDPVCGHYIDRDIWYSAVVPATGYLVITSQEVEHSDFEDSGMAIYTGSCNSLVLADCNDDGPNDFMSEIIIDDISLAGNTIYIRFWHYSDDETGPFEITAYTNPTDAIWTGNTDENWHNAGNWDVNAIPGANTNVTIPVGTAHYPTISQSADCKNFLLKSNATGTASLINAHYLTISGTAEVESYFTSYSSASTGWHFLSSPMNNYSISGSDFVSGTFDLYRWGETTSAEERWLNYEGGSFGHTHFENGLGYLVAYESAGIRSFTGGSLNYSSISKSCSYTPGKGDGWNLLGNPYCSGIDWDLLTKPAAVSATVYIEKASDGTYITWNGTTGDLTNGIIPPHQGFFVEVNAATSIDINPTDQVHPNHAFYKSDNGFLETLKVSLRGESSENNTYIQFRDDATNGFDHHADSYKLFGWASIAQVYTELDGIKYSINCLNHSNKMVTVPLGISMNKNENMSLVFSGLQSFYSSIRIDLEDTKTEEIINIREHPVYSFFANTSDINNRFLLHFNGITAAEDINKTQEPTIYSINNDIYIRVFEKLNASVFIYNSNGQLIFEDQMRGEELKTIDLNISTGVYLVKVQSLNKIFTKKILIHR